MAQRRTSTTSSRPNLGEPYQIYTEVVNAGKNLQGSKRKVRWLFGFTESDQEYEVVLVHSLVSGKKTVYEDGKEIIQSSNVLASDFSHGWNSEICHRLFRVEAEIGLTTEHTYTFSIDGVKFVDMPRKPLQGSKNKTTPKAEPFSSDPARRSSAGVGSREENGMGDRRQSGSNNAGGRGNFQSPFAPSNNQRGSVGAEVDPFASGGDSFDPFGDDEGGFKPNKSATSGSASKNKTTPTAGGNKSAATSLFGAFDDDSTAAAGGNSFDPFGSGGGSATADPFASSTPPSKPAKKVTPVAAPANKRGSAAAAAEPDLFGNFDDAAPAASADPFASSAFSSSAPAGNNKPTRRSSAQEIQMDFEGLSFNPSPPKPVTAAAAAPVVASPPPAPEPEPAVLVPDTTTPKVADPWDAAKNLVDLDLAGRNTKPVPRPSVTNGPTLDNLMGVQTAQRRTSMASTVPVDPFAIPAGGVPPQQRPSIIGGPGPMAAPQAPVYGRGLAGGPAPQMQPNAYGGGGMGLGGGMGMGGGMSGGMGMGGGMSGGMGGMGAAPMGGGPMMGGPQNVRGSIGGAPVGYGGGGMSQYPYQQPGGQQKTPQSSLDTLSWN